jgi:hypothetical protein
MNGGIIFKNSGPIGWLGECQECTSLSLCEAEIWATNTTSKKVIDFCNLSQSASKSDHTLSDINSQIDLYNNKDACVKWSYNMTSKVAQHTELSENSIREWVQDKTLDVCHVAGKVNPADIFTKEMRDGAQLQCLRDSFMSCLLDFLPASLLAIHHGQKSSPTRLLPTAVQASLSNGFFSYFTALASSPFCRTLTNISHLSSAGQHLLCSLHGLVPSGVLWSTFFFWVWIPRFPWVSPDLFLCAGHKDGGCWPVIGPFSRASRSRSRAHFSHHH